MAKISAASGVVGVLLLLALVSSSFNVVEAVTLKTFNVQSCDDGSTEEFRFSGGCQNFIDQSAIQVSDIVPDVRVSVHNQKDCTPESQVGQFYTNDGPICSVRGQTQLRSVYIDCASC